jgi:superfamily II DNA or RNA helicase
MSIPKKVAKIILLDDVNALVSGLRIEDLNHLYEEYGMYMKGHHFHPKVQLKRWDGKIRFFKKTGRTYIELLPEIAKTLSKRGYKIKVKDDRKPSYLNINKIDKHYFSSYGWTLGDHQVDGINAIIEANHRGILKLGTGAGKTLITAVLCDLYVKNKRKVIIIVPTKDLIRQTKAKIAEYDINVGAYFSDEKNLEADVVVSTWQSLISSKKIITMFDALIVDECHGASSTAQLSQVLSDQGKDIPIRIGLTGTLPDYMTDALTVVCNLGPVRATVKARELIERGWLAELDLLMVQFKEDFSEEWEEYKKNNPEEAKNLTYTLFKNNIILPNYDAEKKFNKMNKDRLDIIATTIKYYMENHGNVFVFVNTVEFGKKLAEKMGDNAIFVNSKIKDRSPIYERFDKENNIGAVATFKLASTGLDMPRIFFAFFIDANKAFVEIVQSIGRTLRKADDKKSATVVDMYSDTKFSMRHARKRKKIYKQEGHDFKLIKVDHTDNIIEKMNKALNSESKKALQKEALE